MRPGRSKYDTAKGQKVGRTLPCEWVTIKDPDPTDAEKHPDAVYQQGRAQGAARFLGLEGAEFADGSVSFTASEAGDAGRGQLWRYTPRGLKSGKLTLLFESHSKHVLDQPDSITVSPRGAVVVGEDGDGDGDGTAATRPTASGGSCTSSTRARPSPSPGPGRRAGCSGVLRRPPGPPRAILWA